MRSQTRKQRSVLYNTCSHNEDTYAAHIPINLKSHLQFASCHKTYSALVLFFPGSAQRGGLKGPVDQGTKHEKNIPPIMIKHSNSLKKTTFQASKFSFPARDTSCSSSRSSSRSWRVVMSSWHGGCIRLRAAPCCRNLRNIYSRSNFLSHVTGYGLVNTHENPTSIERTNTF